MQNSTKSRRKAARLFRLCFVDGAVDEDRLRRLAAELAAGSSRDRFAMLSHLLRLIRLHTGMRTASIESAGPLSAELQARILTALTRRYGPGLNASFAEQPSLIGGLRIRVGSDVFDGSLQARLAELESRF